MGGGKSRETERIKNLRKEALRDLEIRDKILMRSAKQEAIKEQTKLFMYGVEVEII